MKKSDKIFSIIFIFIAAILVSLTVIFKWSYFHLAITLANVIAIYLEANKRRLGLLIYVLANGAYAYAAYKTGYYGDAIFYSIVAVPANAVSFFLWGRHLDSDKLVEPRRLDGVTRFSCLFVGALAIFAYGKLLGKMGGLNSYIDAVSTVTSLFGFTLCLLRYKEYWVAWILQAIANIVMYVLVGNVMFIIAASFNLIGSFAGVIIWKPVEEE